MLWAGLHDSMLHTPRLAHSSIRVPDSLLLHSCGIWCSSSSLGRVPPPVLSDGALQRPALHPLMSMIVALFFRTALHSTGERGAAPEAEKGGLFVCHVIS